MFRGYYTLTSDMMTQQIRLSTISNNMANVSTPGYKGDKLISTTFEEALISRTGNRDKTGTEELNNVSMIRVPDGTYVNFEQGSFDQTGRTFDFALMDEGFFEVRTPDGESLYTRNGSFTLDDEGYLFFQHIGRVMGEGGQPLYIGTDKITVTSDGTISDENNVRLGRIRTVNFADPGQLVKTAEGMFQNPGGGVQDVTPKIGWKMLERSNVSAADEMVEMMTAQRALQSAAQIIKMYDNIMNKAANDIGRT